MFWRCEEHRLARALDRMQDKLLLNTESAGEFAELQDWLAHRHLEAEDGWSHDDLMEALLSDSRADKDALLQEVREGLKAMENFAFMLVEKLDAFVATLDEGQRSILREELVRRGRGDGSWRRFYRRARLRDRGRAA